MKIYLLCKLYTFYAKISLSDCLVYDEFLNVMFTFVVELN